MILMYHKVDLRTPSYWWISKTRFEQQIKELVRIGYEFVYLDDYDVNSEYKAVITFDDAYENVYKYAFPILESMRIPFEVFVIGNLISKYNDFDEYEERTGFCSLEQLKEMAASCGRMQWHSRTHPRLPELTAAELDEELAVNPYLYGEFDESSFRWFSYPYGIHDDTTVAAVKQRFSGAVSVNDGSSIDRYQLNRETIHEDWMP